MADADLTRRHLAKIVDSSDDAIVSKDLNGTILSWNAAAERMFGYTAEEAVGRSIRMIIPADRQNEEDFVLGEIRAGRPVQHYDTIRQRKDGSPIPISLTVSPIRSEAGEIIGASKIARDVSERARLEAEARDQAAVAEQLVQVGVAVASSLDRAAIVQKVTDVATKLTGAEFGAFFYNDIQPGAGERYTLYTLSGAPLEAFSQFPHPRATEIFGPTFRGEGVVRLDDVTRDPRYGRNPPYHGMPPGHLPVRSYLAIPVRAAGDEVIGGLFFGHSSPAVFTSQHEQLAVGIAAWATVALENARLYREARDADRLKDEFLAVLSHELRTPLNAIVGYARLLRGGVLQGERVAQAMDTLERNATSLSQIVEDVLDVSRIVTGKIRLDVQPVDLSTIVEEAIATVRPAADARQVRLQKVIDPRIAPVSGDPDRLRQVVWNLLSNAVKFTPRKGRVQIRVERVNSHVEIVVSDTGIGIAPDFLPYVFDRFRQADSSVTRKTGGLGLGLSIVRQIVEMHGGTVEVSSEGENQGATFRVKLPTMIVHPAAQAEADADARQHPLTERRTRLNVSQVLTGCRIAAVDDDQDALGLLRAVLEAGSATVRTFTSGLAALDALGRDVPDALIIDLGMPEIDGFEFIRRLRASSNPRVAAIPAAALTAFARSEDRIKALQAGFEMHLAKPVDPNELVASVATLVRRGRTRSR